MYEENKIVHGLWIGKHLSLLELLCLHSFLAHGHEFHLWTYQPLETKVPDGVVIENASLIIPEEEVFAYKKTNQFGHGKGSYAGFSDIFRYRLLYLYGGWWTDMDVVCLAPLDFSWPYVFRTHHDFPVVGNIMKCPAGTPLMQRCYEKASKLVSAENSDWNLPIQILNDEIVQLGLQQYICEFSNQDSWRYIRNLLFRKPLLPGHWKALHLVNEEWRRNKINKNAIPGFSYLGKCIDHYGIKAECSRREQFKNLFRILIPRSALMQLFWLLVRSFWKGVRLFVKERK